MKCNILTEERWQRMLVGQLTPEEAKEINDHLETDCPDCEEFVTHMTVETESDLRKKRRDLLALHNKTITISASPIVSGQQTFPAQLKKDSGWGQWFRSIWNPPKPMAAGIGGVTVMFLAGIIVLGQYHIAGTPFQNEKGLQALTPTINLEFTTGQRQADGALVVDQGVAGGQYRHDDMLFLKYKIEDSGYVYLVAYEEGRKAELLYPFKDSRVVREKAGEHYVTQQSEIVGLPLDHINGRYHVVGIYSPTPLDVPNQLLPVVQQSINSSAERINTSNIKSLGDKVTSDTIYFDINS